MADTMVLRPGMTATDFKARNTRNVRSAEKLCNVKLLYFMLRFVGYKPSKVNSDGNVGHPDDREVEPIPSISQVGEALQGKP